MVGRVDLERSIGDAGTDLEGDPLHVLSWEVARQRAPRGANEFVEVGFE
jgi:hypothetical protein